MRACDDDALIVSGIGVTTAIGQGKNQFIDALLSGRSNFSIMQRAGRQYLNGVDEANSQFIGAEIPDLVMPEAVQSKPLRNASWTAQVAIATLHEAWQDAGLDDVDPARIGLIIGGSNLQQRELLQMQLQYRDKPNFLRPTYALSFMDSDICGLLSELFGIRGFAFTVGGASASGQLAVIQASEAVKAGRVDVCIALGALMDLSFYECQGFRSLGAMGSDRFASTPSQACRPFDEMRDGFIFGEACSALVIERHRNEQRKPRHRYGALNGWAMSWDANRNPNPSLEGEVTVIKQAIQNAGLTPALIDYINPHGTASTLGDETELKALFASGLSGAYINATKSLVGHGLSAAGIVELATILLQMQCGQLHPTLNLDQPIDKEFSWVRTRPVSHNITNAINLSMGFGGVNTAVCVGRI